MEPLVQATGLHSRWRNTDRDAISDATFDIHPGEFTFIIGPSGSGKSTLLRSMLADANITQGTLRVVGWDVGTIRARHICKLRRKLGVVFQNFQLLEAMTAAENVAFALEVTGMPRARRAKATADALDVVGLGGYANRSVTQLSGGEQQRVAIARAIAGKPSLLIADEPTGNLDPDTSADIVTVLERINQLGCTVIMATHDTDIVDRARRRVIQLNDGIIVRDDQSAGYQAA